MAKKKEPDKLDKLIEELTKDATAEELLKDSRPAQGAQEAPDRDAPWRPR